MKYNSYSNICQQQEVTSKNSFLEFKPTALAQTITFRNLNAFPSHPL